MTGEEIKRLREKRGLTQTAFAQALRDALGPGSGVSASSISRWEKGVLEPPDAAAAFLVEMMLAEGLPPLAPEPEPELDAGAAGPQLEDDSAPGPGPEAQPRIGPTGGTFARACEELFEMVATGVGMVGASLGSEAMMLDGAIIAADKKALGAAWGRLAETNETFRRMLLSATEGGVWLQVALVTGTTVSKCYQSHFQVAERQRAAASLNGHGTDDEPAAAFAG